MSKQFRLPALRRIRATVAALVGILTMGLVAASGIASDYPPEAPFRVSAVSTGLSAFGTAPALPDHLASLRAAAPALDADDLPGDGRRLFADAVPPFVTGDGRSLRPVSDIGCALAERRCPDRPPRA